MQEPSFFQGLRKYALIYGSGAVAALQALKFEIFSFPPNVQLYLGWFFSIVSILCVFLGGPTLLDFMKNINIKSITGDSAPKKDESVNP